MKEYYWYIERRTPAIRFPNITILRDKSRGKFMLYLSAKAMDNGKSFFILAFSLVQIKFLHHIA